MASTAGRYWVFAGQVYYAEGGMQDFRGSYATADEAEKEMRSLLSSPDALDSMAGWAHVLDVNEGLIILMGDSEFKDDKYVVDVEQVSHALTRDEYGHCAWR